MKRIQDVTKQTVSKDAMSSLGQFAVDVVVKRTRLGYGVAVSFGEKAALKGLSANYIKSRKKSGKLSGSTRPSKSNLTFSGQLLASVAVIYAENGRVRFGPTGTRKEGSLTNAQVAGYQEGQGRPFNRISALEFNQILREFRRDFGDLLGKKNLLK